MADAQKRADRMLAATERRAQARAQDVLTEARSQLNHLVESERMTHTRLVEARNHLQSAIDAFAAKELPMIDVSETMVDRDDPYAGGDGTARARAAGTTRTVPRRTARTSSSPWSPNPKLTRPSGVATTLAVLDGGMISGWRRATPSLDQLHQAVFHLRAVHPDLRVAVVADPALKHSLPAGEQPRLDADIEVGALVMAPAGTIGGFHGFLGRIVTQAAEAGLRAVVVTDRAVPDAALGKGPPRRRSLALRARRHDHHHPDRTPAPPPAPPNCSKDLAGASTGPVLRNGPLGVEATRR